MADPPAWSQPYIGIPFRDLGRTAAGADCYGLNRLILRAERGIDLPVYLGDYENSLQTHVIAALIQADLDAADSRWIEVPWHQRQALDWVVYRHGRFPAHLAVVADRDWCLHTASGAVSSHERFDAVGLAHRATSTGLYRHQSIVL